MNPEVEARIGYKVVLRGCQAQKLRQECSAGTVALLVAGHMSSWNAGKQIECKDDMFTK